MGEKAQYNEMLDCTVNVHFNGATVQMCSCRIIDLSELSLDFSGITKLITK